MQRLLLAHRQDGFKLLADLDAAGDDSQRALASTKAALALAEHLLQHLDALSRVTNALGGHLKRNAHVRAALLQPEGAAAWEGLVSSIRRTQLPARACAQVDLKVQLLEAALQAPNPAEAAAAEAAAAAAADAGASGECSYLRLC